MCNMLQKIPFKTISEEMLHKTCKWETILTKAKKKKKHDETAEKRRKIFLT